MHCLKNDKIRVIKSADIGSEVAVWGREDYLIEAPKQLSDREIYEKEPMIPLPLKAPFSLLSIR